MLKDAERLMKAAGDRTRLRIIKMLEPGPLCVCQVVHALRLSQSTVSKHLSILKGAGLVEDERRGKWSYYRLVRGGSGNAGRMISFVNLACAGDPLIAADLARAAKMKGAESAGCGTGSRRIGRGVRASVRKGGRIARGGNR